MRYGCVSCGRRAIGYRHGWSERRDRYTREYLCLDHLVASTVLFLPVVYSLPADAVQG